MKKSLLVVICFLGLLVPRIGRGQSFSVQYDTVPVASVNGSAAIYDYIINHSSSPITLKWHVVNTNFPIDWLTSTAFGLCDNQTCYGNGAGSGYSMQLWNDTTHAYNTFTSLPYGDTTTHGPFDLALNLSTATSSADIGTFFVTVSFSIAGTIGGAQTATFIINRPTPNVVSGIANTETNVTLYPNPARDEVNIVYDANADIKNIAVYNIIGKMMSVYKVNGSSANINLESMPSGIYFVRLVNSFGQVVVTKKFTKQ